MYKKNEHITAKVNSWGDKGLALINSKDIVLQVPDVIPGETIFSKVVKIGKGWAYAKCLEVIEPSTLREPPACDVSITCGGCQLQHLQYEAQMAYKKERVLKAFASKKIQCPTLKEHPMPNPYGYRQKGQFAVNRSEDGNIQIGLSAARSQRVVDTKKCWIQSDPVNTALEKIRVFLEESKADIAHIAFRWVEDPAQLIITLVSTTGDIQNLETLIERLKEMPEYAALYISHNKEANWSVFGEAVTLVDGSDDVQQHIAGLKLAVSPKAFSQSNAKQTERLWERVSYLLNPSKADTIWDLYCGSGGMSMYVAKQVAQVIGIEESTISIKDAKQNVKTNNIDNCNFIQADVADEISKLEVDCDAIIVNPPRTGLDQVVCQAIIERSPKKLVYVSCSPDSLARDLALFVEANAMIEAVEIIDFFPQTYHIETLVLMVFKDSIA